MDNKDAIEVTHPENKSRSLLRNPADKVETFCYIMNHRQAPLLFRSKVVDQLKDWKLLEDSITGNNFDTHDKYRDLLFEARVKARQMNADFIVAFTKKPWNYDWSVEAEYAESELDLFPMAKELKAALGNNVKFIFRAEPATQYVRIVERDNGKRQVLKIIKTNRNVEQINKDSKDSPNIIPRFEAVALPEGKIALLSDWIDGQLPSRQDRELCLKQAEGLLQIPIDKYDLWPGNFKVVKDSMGNKKFYYVDSDVVETIAEKGLDPAGSATRTALFEDGKKDFPQPTTPLPSSLQ